MQYNDIFKPSKLKELFISHQSHPSKRWGQNFLIDKNIVQKIISTANISANDTVIEVGGGCGALTYPLAERAKNVFSYEIDRHLIPVLTDVMSEFKNVEIIPSDILLIPDSLFLIPNYKVVANLPYSSAVRIIQQFLTAPVKPSSLVVIIQKEVAERICAKNGLQSRLSLSVLFYALPLLVGIIPKTCFWPQPRVDSAILKLECHADTPSKAIEESFFRLIRAGFISPKKFLISNLSAQLGQSKDWWTDIFSQLNLSLKIRPTKLIFSDWIKLANLLPS